VDKDRIKAFSGQVFTDMAGAMTAGLGYIGIKTGLFQKMADGGWMTLEEVVQASGMQTRYVDEWLRGMVSAGYLEYEPDGETFRLPDEHAYLLASEGTDHFMGGLFCFAPVLLGVAPKVAAAFEQGGGVPFEEYGAEGVQAREGAARSRTGDSSRSRPMASPSGHSDPEQRERPPPAPDRVRHPRDRPRDMLPR